MPFAVVLIVAGLHVPVILLLDVVGSGGAAEFWHKGPIGVKVGVTWLLTTISIVAVVAHPDEGVNV